MGSKRQEKTTQRESAGWKRTHALDGPFTETKELVIGHWPAHARNTGVGRFAFVNGLRMYYEVHGQGAPVVLLHGALETLETSFGELISTLSTNRQVIAIEQQAHGRTADIDRPLTYERMAADTAELLRLLDIEHADFFGYSMGASLALQIAVQYPNLPRKLALVSGGYSNEGLKPEFWKMFSTFASNHNSQLASGVNRIGELCTSHRGMRPVHLRSIRAPTLLVTGRTGIIVPEHTRDIVDSMPDAQFHVFAGDDHDPRIIAHSAQKLPAFLDAPLSARPIRKAPRSEVATFRRPRQTQSKTHDALQRVFQQEAGHLKAGLSRMLPPGKGVEELVQDAFLAALEQWPSQGVPQNPGAWLMAIAKRRAIDAFRHHALVERKHEALGLTQEADVETSGNVNSEIEDEPLRLLFASCHPALPKEAGVALALRILGRLTAPEIARAFLMPTPTISQRIVRAKRTLAEEHLSFELPPLTELAQRLPSVLEVVYLMFNEGYSATAGEYSIRPALLDEALRLGKLLAALFPEHSETHGLVALMQLQSGRAAARISPTGELIPLSAQEPASWNRMLIRSGLESLQRTEVLCGSGPFALQAFIAACHVRGNGTDWERVAELYVALAKCQPSPVVKLNHAMAVSMARGPSKGLALLNPLASEPSLRGYHLLRAARGDVLQRLGRLAEARREFEAAANLALNLKERQALLGRASECGPRFNPRVRSSPTRRRPTGLDPALCPALP